MRPTTVLLLPAMSLAAVGLSAQSHDYTETLAKASFASMARPGGAWVTSNADYWTPDAGEPREYLMRFSLDADGFVLRGCMWGRSGQQETTPFWTLFHAWDPTVGSVLAYQVSPSGAVAMGHERLLADGIQESIQELVLPGGEVQRVRHLNRALHADTLFSRSFNLEEGRWALRRTYTWIWHPNVASNPCASDPSAINPSDDVALDPLGFLEPLMGTWVPAPEWLAENAGADALVPLALDWGPSRKSIVDQSGLHTANGRLFTFGTIIWNPTLQRAEFSASQSNDDLYFQGFYESIDTSTVRRTYTVHYPDRSPVRYRETFFVVAPDVIDWYTEWVQGGAWVPRRGMGNPEFRAVRPLSVSNEALSMLDRFIGKWRQVDAAGQQVGGSESLLFEWGTARQWIELREHVDENGRLRTKSLGTVAFNPHDRTVTYTGHDEVGAAVRGRLVFVDSTSVERHFRLYSANGTLQSFTDVWRWDQTGNSCFDWTTRDRQSPQRWCRS